MYGRYYGTLTAARAYRVLMTTREAGYVRVNGAAWTSSAMILEDGRAKIGERFRKVQLLIYNFWRFFSVRSRVNQKALSVSSIPR